MDIFTRTYNKIISEARYKASNRPLRSFPIHAVAAATKIATNDFKNSWAKYAPGYGGTGSTVRTFLLDMSEEEMNRYATDESIMDALARAIDYWNNQTGDYAESCRQSLSSFDCPEDKVGLLAYAIWQGVKASLLSVSSADSTFKVGERFTLELKFIKEYTTTYNYGRSMGYRNSYLNRDQHTEHWVFSCDKYPSVIFDIIFSSNDKNWNQLIDNKADHPDDRINWPYLKEGDVVKVEAKVKSIDNKNGTIYMNYGKRLDIVSFAKEEKYAEDDDPILKERNELYDMILPLCDDCI